MEPIHILAIGASMTRGYYKSGCAYHPYSILLQKLLREKFGTHIFVHEYGQNGEQTCEVKDRVLEVLPDQNFGIAILFSGMNDLGYCLL